MAHSQDDQLARMAEKIAADVPQLALVSASIKQIERLSVPPMTLPDVMWLGADVASTVAAPNILRHRGSITGEVAIRMFGLGVSIVAAVAPNLVRKCGFEPGAMSSGILVIGVEQGYLDATGGQQEQLRPTLESMADGVAKSHGRAFAAWRAWVSERLEPSLAAYEGRASDAQVPDDIAAWHDALTEFFTRPLLPPTSKIREGLKRWARKKKAAHLTESDGAIVSLLGIHYTEWIAGTRSTKSPIFFIDRQGRYEIGYPDLIDTALAQSDIKAAKKGEQVTARLDSDEPGESLADILAAPSVSDPAISSVQADLHRAITELLERAARDDLDRRDLALMREITSRRERARHLGVSDVALRKREDGLRTRALRLASPDLRDLLGGDTAA